MLRSKILFTFISFVALFGLVMSKAIYVQVIIKDGLLSYANSQFSKSATIYPKRGNILDRNGSPLAINTLTYNIFTIPNFKTKKEKEKFLSDYRELAKQIPELSLAKIKERIKGRNRYTWLIRKVKLNDQQLAKIKKLTSVHLESDTTRFYPNHELLSQTLGFMGLDNKGLSGVEYFFDEILRGKPKVVKFYRDAKGRAVKYDSKEEQEKAPDINLSIEKELQAFVETTLKEGVDKHAANKGGVGVIDVTTGEILAMANYPSFDSNFPKEGSPERRKLAFISDPFEPGSIFKSFTIASALENKIVKANTKIFCNGGKLKVDNHIISEAEDDKNFQWLTVEDILKYSSNVGTTKIAFELGNKRLNSTLGEFNIGKKIGIELPAESKGIFLQKEKVSKLTLSNVSFGQGVATTGIQILAAYAAIANDGVYITPTILKRNPEDVIPKRQLISVETAKALQKMLVKAVEEGTGKNAIVPHFTIAGKTSTGQRVSESGGYRGHISGFVGFPINTQRRFVIYVYVDNPTQGGYYGNIVAAPIFNKIAQYMLYKNRDIEKIAAKDNVIPIKEKIVDKVETVQSSIAAPSSSSLKSDEKKKVPNFIGLDKITALRKAEELNLELAIKGFGLVLSQNPSPGSEITPEVKVNLVFGPPKED